MLTITPWVIISAIQVSVPVGAAPAFWHLFDFIQLKQLENQSNLCQKLTIKLSFML